MHWSKAAHSDLRTGLLQLNATRSDQQDLMNRLKRVSAKSSYSNQDCPASQPRTAPPPVERASLTPFQELTDRSLTYARVHCTNLVPKRIWTLIGAILRDPIQEAKYFEIPQRSFGFEYQWHRTSFFFFLIENFLYDFKWNSDSRWK